MPNLTQLHKDLDQIAPRVGIDGGNPDAKYWFVGIESAAWGDEYADMAVDWSRVTADEAYYFKIKRICDAAGLDATRDIYLTNLFPIAKNSLLAQGGIKRYGFETLAEYYKACDEHGRAVFKNNLNHGPKRTVICIGLSKYNSFIKQLAPGYEMPHEIEHIVGGQKYYEITPTDHPGISRIIITTHTTRAGYALCDEIGKRITS